MFVEEILVPYESKKVSYDAFKEALRLGSGRKITISVIKFLKYGNSDWNMTPHAFLAGEGVNAIEEKLFEDEMEELHKEAIKQEIPFDSGIFYASEPAKGIIKYVRKNNVKQIVMKSRGRKGLNKIIHGGSVSETIKKKDLPCEVIIIGKNS